MLLIMHFLSIITALILASGVEISFAAPLPAGVALKAAMVNYGGVKGITKMLGNGFVSAKGTAAVNQVKGITKIGTTLKSFKSVPVVPVAVPKGGIGSAAKVGVAAVAGAALGGSAVHWHLATDSDKVDRAPKVIRSPHYFAEDEVDDTYEEDMDDTYEYFDDSIADLD